MSYILSQLDPNKEIPPAIAAFLIEYQYIAKYLSRVLKDKSLTLYNVLFYLSHFETGSPVVRKSWAEIGSYIITEQNKIAEDTSTLKRRLAPLIENKCIDIRRGGRGNAPNEIHVFLPSQMIVVQELIEKDAAVEPVPVDESDYYTDPQKRLTIFLRDGKKCQYCLIDLTDSDFVIDHILPISSGGSNRKSNLVTACEACNSRKSDLDYSEFLQLSYRERLISQKEYLTQKEYITQIMESGSNQAGS